MRLSIRAALVLVPLLAWGAPACAQDRYDPIPAIRANQWALAQAQAAHYADPVAEKLVLFYRLLDPGAASPSEIAAFLHANPDWPFQAALQQRWQDAIAADPDDQDVVRQCAAAHPTNSATLLRCAQALQNTGNKLAADADARQAWITGITEPSAEIAFLRHWGHIITPAEEWTRFQHLAWYDPAAAARQMARLDPSHYKAAAAQLALQRNAPNAGKLLAEVPARLRDDPGLMLDHARYLRSAGKLTEAAALWQNSGAAAQAATPGHRVSFWFERSQLARKLLAQGDNRAAYDVVAAHGQLPEASMAAAEFLAGFIALRRLHDPAAAARDFQELAKSHAAITLGRANYWLGRAAAAAGKNPLPYYKKAAAWPTTFYGQLGALAAGETNATLAARINALRDPAWNRATVLAFTGHELVRAAAWLVAWGDPRRARPFLLRMEELAPDPAEQALTAHFALKLGLPEVAVFIARRMGFYGTMLPQDGWPIPYEPPAGGLDPAVALGIMRQESSFDPQAVSPSGARGLMQLMPPTATQVARQIGVQVSLVSLTDDPTRNMQLGTSYLRDMLARFGGSLPLAVAAYNAGPHRVEEWLATNGDPRTGGIDMLDWLELIPSAQTRNYVQRVLENVEIYRARLGESTPTLLAEWAH